MIINKNYKFVLLNSKKWVVGKLMGIENGFVKLSTPTIYESNPSDDEHPWYEGFNTTEFYLSLSSVFYAILEENN